MQNNISSVLLIVIMMLTAVLAVGITPVEAKSPGKYA